MLSERTARRLEVGGFGNWHCVLLDDAEIAVLIREQRPEWTFHQVDQGIQLVRADPRIARLAEHAEDAARELICAVASADDAFVMIDRGLEVPDARVQPQ